MERVCWFQMPWLQELLEEDISVKELVPVTIAAVLWGPQLSTDNMAAVASLQQRSAKSPPFMHLISLYISLQCLLWVLFSARHVPGVLNEVASDVLSRNKADHIFSLLNRPTGST